MSPALVALAVLLALIGLRFLRRDARIRRRPIFRKEDLFAGRLSEGLLHTLISDRGYVRADTRIREVQGTAVTVERDGACGRLVLHPLLGFGRDQDLPSLRALGARVAPDRGSTIVVVGGSAEFADAALQATAPAHTVHIDDDGAVREARRGFRSRAPRLVVENALDRMEADLEHGAFPSLDLETARGLVSGAADPFRRASIFRGVVTPALTVAIIACFTMEVAISRDALRGDGATLSIAYRMGAIHQPSILEGQWVRLIAAPFLHFGLLHLAMNGWAQLSLGAPIEFLVGPWAFLALWVGSALGASVTSLIFNDSTVAAGASGAIFGLLGAFTTFVFFRKDILPQPVPRPLRNGVLATLVLNLLISFIPSIDMAAHAGGFVTGAVMALALAKGPHAYSAPVARWPLRFLVLGMVLLGVGLTSIRERADLSIRVPEIERDHMVGDLRLPIPKAFTVTESQSKGLTTVDVEGHPASPFSITYRVSEPQLDDEAADRLLGTLRSKEAPPGPSEWIALSRLGVEKRRAIEILVIAPSSCREQAQELGAALAREVR
jgi:membrane associated rhomboid family serine protease